MRVHSSTSQDRAHWGVCVVFGFFCLEYFVLFCLLGCDTSVFSDSSAALEPGTLFVNFHRVFLFAFAYGRKTRP